jgi:LacI family transcriptional regulator
MSIPDATCRRVLDAARVVGYPVAPNPGRANPTLGVVIPRLDSPFFAEIVSGIEDVTNRQGQHMLLAFSDERRDGEAQFHPFVEHHAQAVIFLRSGPGRDLGWVNAARNAHLPIVLAGEGCASPDMDCVTADDAAGVTEAMAHLVQRGHRRIAYLTGPESRCTIAARIAAYKGALVAAKLPFDPAHLIASPGAALAEMMNQAEPPTAILAATDEDAAHALNLLRGRRTVEIVGCGNTELSERLGFSSLDRRIRDVGIQAAELALAHHKTTSLRPRAIGIAPRLVVRNELPKPRRVAR